MRKIIAPLTLAAAILAPAALNATEPVKITLQAHYFTEPATVQVIVTIEPSAKNRMLRIEADGDQMYRSSELELTGDGEQRLHSIQFKNLAAGNYTLRAAVLSDRENVIAMDEDQVVVSGH